MEQALSASDAIYFEADVWSGGEQHMAAIVQEHGINPEGVTLSASMSKEAWNTVSAYAAQYGIPAEGLEQLQPWLATVTLGMVSLMAQGYDQNSGVDMRLHSQLSAEARELRFFEGAEEQIRFLADLPLETQISMLLDTVRQASETPDAVDRMLEAWLAGDLEALDEIGNHPMQEFSPGLFDALIVYRNESWVDDLSNLMDTPGVYFVAVGTLHLPGEYGIIELMRERGFDVTLN